MGHTLIPKRQVLYARLEGMETFARTLRKPYRERFLSLLTGARHQVSAAVYANLLNDEEAALYAMLANLMGVNDTSTSKKVRQCLAIMLAGDD
ncbi:MAG: hypothetical protein Q8P05_00815 [Candidatus Diapherotrites archaeon]|nr:hypothetical protein [Candidatus Diapherotrites archaeon]